MDHLPEILKIIEAGLSADAAKVRSYADLFAKKLDKGGDEKSAARIRRAASGTMSRNGLSPALNGQASVPVDRDSRFTLADESFPTPEMISIRLPPIARSKVDEFLKFVKESEKLQRAGVGVSPSMLIYGPPGCGKSYLAHHVAAQLDLPLLTTRCDSLVSSYLGSTAKNLRKIFEHSASRPCVLFLDEFDALAKARDDQHELGELKRVVVSLLQNIDALPSETVVVAATNHEKLLDPAVWRRFAYQVHLREPNEDIRQQLVAQFLGNYAPKSTRSIVRATDGLSGAVMQQACEAAIRSAILEEKKAISEAELLAMLAHIQYAHVFQSTEDTDELIRRLRKENAKMFTTRLLANMFGVSVGKVSKLLNS